MQQDQPQQEQDPEIVLNLKLSEVKNIIATLGEVPFKYAEVPINLITEMTMKQLSPIAPPPEADFRPRIIKG